MQVVMYRNYSAEDRINLLADIKDLVIVSATAKAHLNCKVNGENWIVSLSATQLSTEMVLRREAKLLNYPRYPCESSFYAFSVSRHRFDSSTEALWALVWILCKILTQITKSLETSVTNQSLVRA